MKIKLQNILVLQLFFSSLIAQDKSDITCARRIENLYHKVSIHLIFCAYYDINIKSFSYADTILEGLSYHRDSSNVELVKTKDEMIINNLKLNLCPEKVGLIDSIEEWCRTSMRLAKYRNQKQFTLEGYIDFLNTGKETKKILKPYLKENKLISSLSTYELEMIYFDSIYFISRETETNQKRLFDRLKSWKFI